MAAPSAGTAPVAIDAQRLVSAVADIFKAVGIAAADARVVADDLVTADLDHGSYAHPPPKRSFASRVRSQSASLTLGTR